MDVVVCVKQIPNPDAPQAFDPESRTLLRPGPLVLDDSDTFSVEIALRIVEQAGGGQVTLVSVVPDGETSGIRTALAMGADKAVLVSDPALSGLDALGTAKILAAVVRRANPQLVLAATESSDGYTGTVPVQLAELLEYPAVTFAKHIEVKDGVLAVQRQTEEGYDEIECPLPAIVTVTAGVVEVRYPSFKGIMSAKSKPVEQLSVADLGLDPTTLGANGARQEIVDIEKAEVRSAGQLVTDEGAGHESIITALESWKVL
ncbi:MAG TPA: electron transfer flavoprotein subunit beta/FixA family protein [Acidimicrobiales bacterium]|jgi:electron transfer flavoprotein beta subunit|nr:electron transfer flavoprotein subunit beta/FixA family protein [Acidimicrobiales bacterium]